MKVFCLFALLLCTASAFATGGFRADSPVPQQLQARILEAAARDCPAAKNLSETSTSVNEAAGETYYETKLSGDGTVKVVTVISGVGRLGGFAVIKVDCGA